MFSNIFNSNFVKLPKQDWEDIKKDYNALVQENKQLKEQVAQGTSAEVLELKAIIQKQSDSLKNLARWKDNDDLIFQHEQMQEVDKEKIKSLESQVKQLEKDKKLLQNAYNIEKELSSIYAKKLGIYKDCPTYETVSKLDLKA